MIKHSSPARWLFAALAWSMTMVASGASAESSSIVWDDFDRSIVWVDGLVFYDSPSRGGWWYTHDFSLPGPGQAVIEAPDYRHWSALESRPHTTEGTFCRAWLDITGGYGTAAGIYFSALNLDGSVRSEVNVPELTPGQTTRAYLEFWSTGVAPQNLTTRIRVGQWGNGYAPSSIIVDNFYLSCG